MLLALSSRSVITHGFHTFFVWSKLTMTKRCACCDQTFLPRPQAPNQTYCLTCV
jgi:hypothetical protein